MAEFLLGLVIGLFAGVVVSFFATLYYAMRNEPMTSMEMYDVE